MHLFTPLLFPYDYSVNNLECIALSDHFESYLVRTSQLSWVRKLQPLTKEILLLVCSLSYFPISFATQNSRRAVVIQNKFSRQNLENVSRRITTMSDWGEKKKCDFIGRFIESLVIGPSLMEKWLGSSFLV